MGILRATMAGCCVCSLSLLLRSLQWMIRIIGQSSKSEHVRAPAPRLPPEIVLLILRDMLDDSPYRLDDQVHLSSISRVCKSWCGAAFQLVYERPIISFDRSLIAYTRAVRIYPGLGDSLKRLILGRQADEYRDSTVANSRVQRLQVRKAFNYLTERNPRHMASLTIVGSESFAGFFLRARLSSRDASRYPAHHLHISTLVITDCAAPWANLPRNQPPTSPYLPNLEVLCFRRVTFEVKWRLPNFAKLHTLRIVQCVKWRKHTYTGEYGGQVFVEVDDCPSLRTLALYKNHIPFQFFTNLLQQLYSLRFFRTKLFHDTYYLWDNACQWGPDNAWNVRKLAIFLGEFSSYVVGSRDIEELMIVVGLSEGSVYSDDPDQRLSVDSSGNLNSLKQLTLVFDTGALLLSCYRGRSTPAPKFKHDCEVLGVDVKVEFTRAIRTRAQSQERYSVGQPSPLEVLFP